MMSFTETNNRGIFLDIDYDAGRGPRGLPFFDFCKMEAGGDQDAQINGGTHLGGIYYGCQMLHANLGAIRKRCCGG